MLWNPQTFQMMRDIVSSFGQFKKANLSLGQKSKQYRAFLSSVG